MPTGDSDGDLWKHWYELPTDNLAQRQGDIFQKLVVPLLPHDLPAISPPPSEPPDIVWDIAYGNWITLSASCDIDEKHKQGYVLIAQVLPVELATLRAKDQKELDQKCEVIRRGWDPVRFLLPGCPDVDPTFPLSFVQYRTQAFVPLQYLRASSNGPRLRLRAPFREKLGIWAGSGFSRVGIEDSMNIPPFLKNLFAMQVLKASED